MRATKASLPGPRFVRVATLMLVVALCTSILAHVPLVRAAGAAKLVKDINTHVYAPPSYRLRSPSRVFTSGGITYFTGTDLTNDRELWRTDGTSAGTSIVRDINPGPYWSSPYKFTDLNGTLYFFATEETTGIELWRSNGTASGTYLVKDLTPGQNAGGYFFLTVFNNRLFFRDNETLYVSDGTDAGTHLLKRMDQQIQGLVVFNNALYIFTGDGYERNLWKSDGTEAGTTLLKQVGLKNGDVSFEPLPTIIDNSLYFVANKRLWRSDGSAQGTVRVRDDLVVEQLTKAGTTLFIDGGTSDFDGLWSSNGSAAGTRPIKELGLGGVYSPHSGLTLDKNGILFFSASDASVGTELWKSDGTPEGTLLVKNIQPGNGSSEPFELTLLNDTVYFIADDGTNGKELWRSDGTNAGTTKLTNATTDVSFLSVANGQLFFSLQEPFAGDQAWGLWKSNGTTAGTVRVKHFIDAGAAFPDDLDGDPQLAVLDHRFFFAAWQDYSAPLLFTSDGNANTTQPLTAANGQKLLWPHAFSALNDTMIFTAASSGTANDSAGVWRSDGTKQGTTLVKNILNVYHTLRVGNSVYIQNCANNCDSSELWKTDGTTNGTTLVATFDSRAGRAISVNNLLFFSNSIPRTGQELWRSDGTTAGTRIVKDIGVMGDGAGIGPMIAFEGKLLFSTQRGRELWISDGSEEGTQRIKSIFPYTSSFDIPGISNFTLVGNRVFFSAADREHGRELWVTDGTSNGTLLLKDINTSLDQYLQNTGSEPAALTALNGKLLFSADDGVRGRELWTSDGTPEGTTLLADLAAGPTGSMLYHTSPVKDGRVLLSIAGDRRGVELWSTDGTTGGTGKVADIAVGGGSSFPKNFTRVGESIAFTADDGIHGRELWFTSDLQPDPAPIAMSAQVKTSSDMPFSGVLQAADSNNQVLSFQIETPPTKGKITLNAATGAFSYTPLAGATGSDRFTFFADDGISDSNIATVNIDMGSQAIPNTTYIPIVVR